MTSDRPQTADPGEMRPARQHGYRVSAFERRANDFYPTPSDLAISLALGLPRLRVESPSVALDPCGGDGALRRGLAPFGVDVRLSDLYPEMYQGADGYVTSEQLDASEPERLRHAFELAGPDCTAVITNTPHNTREAYAIVKNLIALVEGSTLILPRRCSGQSGGPSQGDFIFSTGHRSAAKSFAVGVPVGSRGAKEARCTLTHGTFGERRRGLARV